MTSSCSRCGAAARPSDGVRDYCAACLNLRGLDYDENDRICRLCKKNTSQKNRFLCRPCNTKSVIEMKRHNQTNVCDK